MSLFLQNLGRRLTPPPPPILRRKMSGLLEGEWGQGQGFLSKQELGTMWCDNVRPRREPHHSSCVRYHHWGEATGAGIAFFPECILFFFKHGYCEKGRGDDFASC